MEAALCFGFQKSQWTDLKKRLEDGDEAAWSEAIGVFDRRIRERFFSSIDALFAADSKPDKSRSATGTADHCVPGFAIMAICCLLIDTLQGFRETPPATVSSSGPCTYPSGQCIKPFSGVADQFKSFLRRAAFGEAFKDDAVAQAFVNGIRHAILHDAETRRWVIWRDEPPGQIVQKEQNGFALNRTLFYHAVKAEFECYVRELRSPSNSVLRQRFRKKMNDIAKRT